MMNKVLMIAVAEEGTIDVVEDLDVDVNLNVGAVTGLD